MRIRKWLARFAVYFAVSSVLSLFALAGDPPTSAFGSEPFSAQPADVLKAAKVIAPDKYPHVTILLDEFHFLIDESRRITRTHRSIYRVDSPKAVTGWSNASQYWEPWHQAIPEVKVRVITADAKEFWLDEKTLSDSPARKQSDDVYTDTRYYGGPIPGVAAGAIVEEYTVRRDTAPFFEGGTVQRLTIGSEVPSEQSRVVIEYPASLALQTKVKNLPALTQRKEVAGGTIKITFENPRIEALPAVPNLIPPELIVRGTIEFSTGQSWASINEKYHRTIEQQLQGADVRDLVGKIVKESDPRPLKIAKLVAALHEQVRYTGIEFGEASLVPRTPQETLTRHFGDCKDKSTLLVAMLKAAGIPASLALVRSSSPDLDTDLPGMAMFDHAIVFVPGNQELWIDATAEYNVLGNIPPSLNGKNALVVDGTSGKLKRIPEAKSADNRLVEQRDIFLAEYGPAKVVEIGTAAGFIDAGYRASFSGPLNKSTQESLDSYGRNVYLADSNAVSKASNAHDLLTPFKLELEFAKVRRGFTETDDAIAAMRREGLFFRMPKWFSTAPDEKNRDSKTEAEPPRTADYYFAPHQIEWHYTVHPPVGFSLDAIPADVSRTFGPAKLTENWHANADGSLSGTVRFDSMGPRYSVKEAEAARDAIVAALKEPALMFRFNNTGSALISAGKIKEGLAEYERTIKLQPDQALHRVRISLALLQAGLGEQARIEARAAVKLDEKSPQALNNLGWVLEHDLLGRRFERGFDRDGAIEAYKRAMVLAPKESSAFISAGIISEFNNIGERYADGARLDDAISYYRKVRMIDKAKYDQFEANELLCLLYSRKFDEALSVLGNRVSESSYRFIALSALAATKGSNEALLQSSRFAANQSERSTNLRDAARILVLLREYAKAADLIAGAIPGSTEASSLQSQVELFRHTKRYTDAAPPPGSPASAVHRLFVALGTHRDQAELDQFLSKSWQKSGTQKARDVWIRQMRAAVMNAIGDTGFSNTVNVDLLTSNTDYSAEGDDKTGYRVWVRLPDAEPQPVFVVKENLELRVLAFRDIEPIGWEAWTDAQSSDWKKATQLLDWTRQQMERGGGEDSIGGNSFALSWDKNNGKDANRETVELAALSLLLSTTDHDFVADAKRLAATLPKDKAFVGSRSIWQALADVDKWNEAEEISSKLLKQYPKSDTAYGMEAVSLLSCNRAVPLEKLAREKLAIDPDNPLVISLLNEALVMQDRVPEAREVIKSRIKSSRATAEQLNSYAWEALFTKVDDEAVEIARRSSSQSSQSSYGILHTLACIYAERGQTNEAREVMLKAMKAENLEELDSALWFVYGRIAEQYGQVDAARAAYARVEKPEAPQSEKGSTYSLARIRLSKMAEGKEEPVAGGSKAVGPTMN